MSEVELMSSTQQQIGFHISQQIAQPIDSFVNRKLNKQALRNHSGMLFCLSFLSLGMCRHLSLAVVSTCYEL